MSSSTSSSSAALSVAPGAGAELRRWLGVKELFVGTPSQVYGRESEDTQVEVPNFSRNTLGQLHLLAFLLCSFALA